MSEIITRSNFRMRYKGLCRSNCILPSPCSHSDLCRKVVLQNSVLDNNLERVLFNFKIVSYVKH